MSESSKYYRHLLHRTIEIIKILIVPVILLIAFWVLFKLIKHVRYDDLVDALYGIKRSDLVRALLLCALNYFVLTLYDLLAFRYIRHKLSYAKIAFTACISFAFSQTVGFAFLSGGAIRYRLYSSWGCSAQEIAKLIAFSGIHFWMGLFLLSGVACLVVPGDLLKLAGISETGSSWIGIVFIAPILAYFVLTLLRRKPVRMGQWELPMPSLPLAAASVGVACLDWIIVAGILHALLPSSPFIPFHRLTVAFFLSQAAGVLSHVPGGLGVFEAVMLVTLTNLSQSQLLASLLLFRVVYYLVPFVLALGLLLMWEFLRGSLSTAVKARFQTVDTALSGMVPPLLALNAFIAGVVLLFSGITPPAPSRLIWVKDLIPLPLLEISHFLNSIAATLLMVTAWSLWKRVNAAYAFTLILLFAGAAASIVKGFDYEEAALLLLVAFIFYRCRRYFYRRAEFLSGFRFQTLIAVLVILATSVWLSFFVYANVQYRSELWWRFAVEGDASRFMRAMAGSVIILLIISLRYLLKPAALPAPHPFETDLATVESIVENIPSGSGKLAYMRDKSLLFSERADAFLMYRNQGSSWVALGNPSGSADSWDELIWRFRDLADQHDGHCAFYQIPAESLFHYVDLGMNFVKLGEEGLVSLSSFSLDDSSVEAPGRSVRNLEGDGISFSIKNRAEVRELLPVFRKISDEWLAARNTADKGFSMGFFSEDYISRFPAAVVHKGEEILGFANLWTTQLREELSIDLIRQSNSAPEGILDFLFVNTMLWGRQEGYKDFNIGMAPIAGHEEKRLEPFWNKVGAFLYQHGEHFYTLESLRSCKQRFNPRWEPAYLVYQGKLELPRILADTAALISGGLKNVLER